MATPEVDPGWLAQIGQWAAAVAAAAWSVWKYVDSKLNKTNEHIEKLYENAEQDRRFTRDLHDKAMEAIAMNHRETMRAIRERRND